MNAKPKTKGPLIAKSGEVLFVKCVKDGIPNRDPLRDSDARRLFGDDDGRISLSDVSIKRDVRDFVLSKYPEGDEPPLDRFVFVQKKFNDAHTSLLGRDGLAQQILDRVSEVELETESEAETETESEQVRLMRAAYDVRVFGAVFSVTGKSFNQTGPVQFGWAHSLHPVETKYTQGTVVMPSKAENVEEGEKGKTQGTIWTQYHLPFAVFAMPAVINSTIAAQTGMTERDTELLLESLWKGTLSRQARGRGIQQPLLLCHIEYKDPFFRIGFLDELVSVKPAAAESESFSIANQPTRLSDIELDLSLLSKSLADSKDKIESVKIWASPNVTLAGKGVSQNTVAGFDISNDVPEESQETA